MERPLLEYLEIPITDRCNLRCNGCCEMSNLDICKKEHTLEGFVKDLRRMSELFSGIGKIRIMGGEPLLVARLPEYVAAAREIFPDSDIRIVTNGLLIPSVSESVLDAVRDAGCGFDISCYPPTRKKLREIESALENKGIPYHVTPIRWFFRAISETPHGDPGRAYRNCLFSYCHSLRDGKLSGCSYAQLGERLNTAYGLSLPEKDCIDIHTTELDGAGIKKLLDSPHVFCSFCARGLLPIRWSDASTRPPKVSDWVAPDNILNTRLLPAATRLVKPAAEFIRSKIQNGG